MYPLLTILLFPITYIVDGFIFPSFKCNIQLVTATVHHSSADLSYFCLLLDTDKDGQQTTLPWIFWFSSMSNASFESFSWAVVAALSSSFISPLPRGQANESHLGIMAVLAAVPWSRCLSCCHRCPIADWKLFKARPLHIQQWLSHPAVPKHHQGKIVLTWQQQTKTSHHYQKKAVTTGTRNYEKNYFLMYKRFIYRFSVLRLFLWCRKQLKMFLRYKFDRTIHLQYF